MDDEQKQKAMEDHRLQISKALSDHFKQKTEEVEGELFGIRKTTDVPPVSLTYDAIIELVKRIQDEYPRPIWRGTTEIEYLPMDGDKTQMLIRLYRRGIREERRKK